VLEKNTPRSVSLTLSLGEKVGPPLKLPPEQVGAHGGASPTWVAVALFALIGLAFSALLIPLSQGHLKSPWSDELRLILPESWGSDAASQSGVQEISQAAVPTPEITAAEVALLMGALKGKYCFNYMPYGDDAVAKDAFLKLYWSKLDEELVKLTEDRLEVCSQFAYKTPEVLVSGGCQKSNCGTNDVTFYINRQGNIAMDYRVEGECRYAAEDGFTQVSLLCSD
jgi:hypothetical protein